MPMRRFCQTCFVLAMMIAQPVAGQAWEVAESGPEGNARQRHDDVGFVSASQGWLVNTRGEIWRSDDGGHNWAQQLDSNGFYRFRAIAPLDSRNAFVGTVQSAGAVLFTTTDGGDTWTDVSNRISGTQPVGVCGMSVVTPRVAYGVGAYYGSATMIKTTNAGATWTGRSLQPLAETLVDVHFFDENTGIAVGGTSEQLRGNAVVLRTTDGGSTWSRVYESSRSAGITGEWGWKISFPSPLVGYVSVEYGSNNNGQPAKVLKTLDGGVTWTPIPVTGSVSRNGLQGIGFISEDEGWASGRGVTSYTSDGGATWQQLRDWAPVEQTDNSGNVLAGPEGQLDGSVNRILIVNDTLAVAVGRRVYLLNPVASTAITEAPPVPDRFRLAEAYPNPFEDAVTLRYELLEPGPVRVEVVDAVGRTHGVLLSEFQAAGSHEVTWAGTDEAGRKLGSGMYFLVVDFDRSPEVKQVVLIR